MPLFIGVIGIFSILLGITILAIVFGFLLPSKVHVKREILISASSEQIFALIGDFHTWPSWSLWAKVEADAAVQISGSGADQVLSWSSDDPQVGSGSQTIISYEAPRILITRLNFGDNIEAETTFKLVPEGDKIRVVWVLDTDMRAGVPLLKQPINTYFGFLLGDLIGKEHEVALHNLKAIAENLNAEGLEPPFTETPKAQLPNLSR